MRRGAGIALLVAVALVIGLAVTIVTRGHGHVKADAEVGPYCSVTVDGHFAELSVVQAENAALITSIAIRRGMPARAASIALATAYQESDLYNLKYGDRDSLGLFQQRPSMGWGTEQQILTPRLAADAFLSALQQHQAGDPGWAHQPLWANAQAVQNSGFPFAYAKWETQAAHLVRQVVTQVK